MFQNISPSVKAFDEVIGLNHIRGKIRARCWLFPSIFGALALSLSAGAIVLLLRPLRFDGVVVRGSHRFKNRVVDSLSLLRAKAPDAYQVVTNGIGAIVQSKHSGMAAYRQPPTFELNDATAYASVTWCASCIAHDSLHARFYSTWLRFHPSERVVPHDVWMGQNAEMLCAAHQVRVLREIGAPANEIAHCSSASTNRYWEVDYKKRNW